MRACSGPLLGWYEGSWSCFSVSASFKPTQMHVFHVYRFYAGGGSAVFTACLSPASSIARKAVPRMERNGLLYIAIYACPKNPTSFNEGLMQRVGLLPSGPAAPPAHARTAHR